MLRRTRIVATLGPATDRPGVFEKMLQIGLDVARINFSHGSAENTTPASPACAKRLRRRAGRSSVLADLPGPKLRVLLKEPIDLTVGQQVAIALNAEGSGDLQSDRTRTARQGQGGPSRAPGRWPAAGPGGRLGREQVSLKIEVGGPLLAQQGHQSSGHRTQHSRRHKPGSRSHRHRCRRGRRLARPVVCPRCLGGA